MAHPLQFGVLTIQDLPWPTLVEHWQHIEALGFDSVWVADHFVNSHFVEDNWFDGWALLAALATQTHTIKIGTLVTNMIYRHPAVIARQAQTVDHISQGRLLLGIGATSAHDPSHALLGIENWPIAERIQRYREVVEIVDLMLRQDTTTYQGHYYQVNQAPLRPAALQKPRPPLVLASGGEMTLKIAAKHADTWNTFGGWNDPPEQALVGIQRHSQMLDEYCVKIGRDPGEITRSLLAGLTGDTPFASIGAFQDFIGRYQAIGISEFIFYYDYPALPPEKCLTHEMLERIATEAMPAMRSSAAI